MTPFSFPRFFKTVRGRLMAAFLLAVLLPLLGTTLYGNWITSKIIRERALEASHADTLRRASQVRDFLDNVENDVLYLATLDDLRRLLEAQRFDEQRNILRYRQELAREYYTFAATHPHYYQVRFLDASGQEVVRVDSDGQQAHIIPWDQLQDKSDRYYFTETIALPPGALYVSPLDLNREHGQVEIPHTPVIRYAMPVDYLGERAGIVIINVFADSFLRFLEDHAPAYDTLLVDSQGYYLMHPQEARRWGSPRDLDTGYRLQRDFPPDVVQRVLSGRVGVAQSGEATLVFAPIHVTGSEGTQTWMVVRVEAQDTLYAPVRSFRLTAGGILAAAILFSVFSAFTLATRFTRPIEALQEGVRAFARRAEYRPLPIPGEDEIGQLTQEFNRMARLLQKHIAQLTGLNEAGRRMTASLERQPAQQAVLEAIASLLPVAGAALQVCRADERCRLVSQSASLPPALSDETLETLRREARTQQQACSMRVGQVTVYCACLPLSAPDTWYLLAWGTDPDLQQVVMHNLFATLSVQASVALENVLLYERLAEHRQRLARLLQTTIRAQEEERKMVAYDLHDGLIQDLVGVRLCLSNFAAWQQQAPELAGEALQKGREQLTQAIREARRLLQGLRPTLLDDLGLLTALRETTRENAELGQWQVHLDLPEDLPPMDEAIEMTAFRILQEALANIRKHAQAHNVSLRVRADDRLHITVQDDGRGFEPQALPDSRQSIGLTSMRERAYLVGGVCRVHSAPGAGTRIEITLPLQLEEEFTP